MPASRKRPPKKGAGKTLNTQWINNALKSIGAASTATFKDIMPYTAEQGATVVSAANDVVKKVRTSKASTSKISSALGSNKYVQIARNAVKQSIDDLKTGNLYNPDRPSGDDDWGDTMDDFMGGFDDWGDFEDSGSSVNFTYVDEGGSDDGQQMYEFADIVSKSSTANLKAQKATIDTMVGLSSTQLMANQQLMGDLRSSLEDTRSSVDAILSWHEENTQNFYSSVLASLEKIGAAVSGEKGDEDWSSGQKDDPINSLFNSDGGINASIYKDYVKKNLKRSVENSTGGQLLSFLKDETMLQMLVDDPIGGLTKGVIGGMIPKVIQGTLTEVDKAFTNFLPNMLTKLGRFADDRNATPFMQTIGRIFGLRISNAKNVDLSDRFKGEKAVFDDVTRNTVVEVLPKYARESTQYLRVIAEKVTGKNGSDILGGSQVFNLKTSQYEDQSKVQENLAKGIQDSIVSAFQSSEFGKVIDSMGQNLTGETQKTFENVAKDLYSQLSRVQGGLMVSDFDLNNANSSVARALLNVRQDTKDEKKSYRLIRGAIQRMYNEGVAVDSATNAYVQSNLAKEKYLSELSKNPEFENLISAGVTSETDMDEFVDKYTGNKRAVERREKQKENQKIQEQKDAEKQAKDNKKEQRDSGKNEIDFLFDRYLEGKEYERNRDLEGKGRYADRLLGEDYFAGFERAGGHLKDSMMLMMKGDGKAAINEFGKIFTDVTANFIHKTWNNTKENFLTPLKETFFGKKDEQGFTRGGLMESVQNSGKDFMLSLKQRITGKDYTDSKGETHRLAEGETSFMGEATKMVNFVKDGIKEKLFGKRNEDDGSEKEGFVKKAGGVLMSGLAGWKEAIFGKSKDGQGGFGEEDKEAIKQAILKNTPRAALGATAGMLTGMLAGGKAGSILGMMIGGPVGGAVLGMAGGLLSNNEKFKEYLFGPEVEGEDGQKQRIGGLISKKTQDFVKKNGKLMAGGAALGMLKGMFFPGAGLLTNILGGPLAGAAVGIGSTMLLRSKTFNEFLFGNEETGKRGILDALKTKAFGGKDKDGKDHAGALKAAGMGILGAGAGGLGLAMISKIGIMGALAGPWGPIGGAIAGAAVGIAATGSKFREWMFGKEDEESGEKKGGMIQKFQNWMHVEIVAPLKTKAKGMFEDIRLTIKHDILENIRLPFLAVGDAIKSALQPVVDKGKEIFGNAVQKVLTPIGKGVNKLIIGPIKMIAGTVTDLTYKTAKAVITAPFKLLGAMTKAAKSWARNKINRAIKAVVGGFASASKFIAKGIVGGGLKVFKGIAGFFSNRFKNVKNVAGKVKEKVKSKLPTDQVNSLKSKYYDWRARNEKKDPWMADYFNTKSDRAKDFRQAKMDRKNEKALDKNRQKMARMLGYDVSDFTEENMKKAEAAAKKKGKVINWKRGVDGEIQFDETKESRKAKFLAQTNAQIAKTGDMSDDPEIRSIGQREQIRYTIEETNRLIREFMDNGFTEEEATEKVHQMEEENVEQARRMGINPDGTITEDSIDEAMEAEKAEKKKQKALKKRRWMRDVLGLDAEEEGEEGDNDVWNEFLDKHNIGGEKGRRKRAKKEAWRKQQQEQLEKEHNRARGISNAKQGDISDEVVEAAEDADAARAEGGPVEKGEPYIVGDGGKDPSARELLVPNESGHILSQKDGGMKVQVTSFGKTAFNGLKVLLSSIRGKLNIPKEATEEVVVHNPDGSVSVQQMTKSAAAKYKQALDVKSDKEKAQAADVAHDLENEEAQKANDKEAQAKRQAEEDEKEYKTNMRSMFGDLIYKLGSIGSENKEHNSLWSKIFSKKGLLTGGLMLALPFIIDNLPGIMNGIANFVSAVGPIITGIGTAIGDIFDNLKSQWKWGKENDANENGETTGERVQENLNDLGSAGKKLLHGDVLGATGTFITGEDGEWDSQSDARLRFIPMAGKWVRTSKKTQAKVLRGAGKAAKYVGSKLASGVKTVGSKIGGTKAGQAIATGAKTAVSKVGTAAKTVGSKVAGSKAGTAVSAVAKTAKEGAKGLAGKFIQMMSSAFDMIIKAVAKRFPKASAALSKALKPVLTKVSEFITSHVQLISQKFTIKSAARTAGDVATGGASRLVYAGLGAINGASGTAKLFQVNEKDVDAKMIAISAAMGALTGASTIAALFEVVGELIADAAMGMDLMHAIAVAIYKAISSDGDDKELDDAIKNFQGEYEAYQTETLQKEYETQKEAGIISADMTFEEFRQGIKDGTTKAKYKSFQNYNTSKNGSLIDKAAQAITGGWKNVKNFVKKKETFTDEKGQQYIDNGDGSFTIKKDGKEIGTVSKDAVDTSNMTSTKSGGLFGNIAKGAASLAKNTIGRLAGNLPGARTAVAAGALTTLAAKKAAEKNAENKKNLTAVSNWNRYSSSTQVFQAKDGSFFVMKKNDGWHKLNANADDIGTFTDKEVQAMQDSGTIVLADASSVKNRVSDMTEIKQQVRAAAKTSDKQYLKLADSRATTLSAVVKKTATEDNEVKKQGLVIEHDFSKPKKKGWYRADGQGYYVEAGDYYNYYNMNGDLIGEKVSKEEVQKLMARGLLTEGDVIEDSSAQEAMSKITSSIKDTWNAAKQTVASGWDSFKNWLTGKNNQTSITDTLISTIGTTPSTSPSLSGGTYGAFGTGSRRSRIYGGRGPEPETVNGAPYFSQNDPKWKEMAYDSANVQDGGTMGDTGCGPTALAMVAGGKKSPVDFANLAKRTGYRDATGTNASFIEDASDAMNMPHDTVEKPNADYIRAAAASGSQMILNGVSQNNGPFTDAGHYVVVVGQDKNGNILVNDPRGKSYSKAYKPEELAAQTDVAWRYQGGGGRTTNARRNILKGKLKKYKGKGVSGDWIAIVRAVKKAFADKKPTYNQGGSMTININGKDWTVRPDCSGLVGACLRVYGAIPENANVTSSSLMSDGAIKEGFTKGGWPGWEGLQEGDIITRNGHVEIFARNDNGIHYVYNGGSTTALCSPDATPTGHKQGYDVVWRPGNAGTGEGSVSIGGTSDGTATTGGTTSSSGTDFISRLTSGLTSIGSQFLSAAVTGDWDHTFTLDNPSSDSSGTTSGADVSGGAVASNLTGSNETEKIWNHLTSSTGLDKYAAAGMMGCWQCESSNNPNTFEGNYLSGAKSRGGFEGIFKDNSSINEYVQNVVFPAHKVKETNKKYYKGSDGNYYPGMGLAQWTGPRAETFFKWSKDKNANWYDLGTQLGYVDYEIKGGKRGTPSTYNGASSVEEGLKKVLGKYEGCRTDGSQYTKRLPHAKRFFELYGGNGVGGRGDYVIDDNVSFRGEVAALGKDLDFPDVADASYDYSPYNTAPSVSASLAEMQGGESTSYQDTYTSMDGNRIYTYLESIVKELVAISGNTKLLEDLPKKLSTTKTTETPQANNTTVVVPQHGKRGSGALREINPSTLPQSKNSIFAAKVAKGVSA